MAPGASGCPPPPCRSVLPLLSLRGDHVLPASGVNKASLSLLSSWGRVPWLPLGEGLWWWGDETEARPSCPPTPAPPAPVWLLGAEGPQQ